MTARAGSTPAPALSAASGAVPAQPEPVPTRAHGMNESALRMPSLDGLRAISIVLVILGHVGGTRGFPLPISVTRFFALGDLGVRVFFVISGYLITTLLIRELGRTGRINVRHFYFRRTFRIFPPYYAFLAVLAVAAAVGWVTLAPGDLAHAASYTSNYHFTRSWYVGHTWSLAVEEQFYLLWPAVIVMLGMRRALTLALVFVLLAPFYRLALWYFVPAWHPGIGTTFETVGDAIAIGCLLAGARDWLWSQPRYRDFLGSRWFLLVPALILTAAAAADRPRLNYFFAFFVMNVGAALCIDWCSRFPEGRVGRFLNARPVVFIGVMSYSIYLWQQLFLDRSSTATLASFPLNLAMVAVASMLSYYLVERPSLRLRQHLETRYQRRRAGAAADGASHAT